MRTHGFSLLETIFALSLTAVIAAIAFPTSGHLLASFRLSADARALTNTVALAKLRATSGFTQSRIYMDLAHGTYHLETWQKDVARWVAGGSAISLSDGISTGFRSLLNPPPQSQATIAQAPPCQTEDGASIVDTACILFSWRGISVDSAGAPINGNAYYITDGTTVVALTVSASGFVQLWRTDVTSLAWLKQ
jgi:prepilin-type N-terminal cleavage/methylation domain-containing protein